MFHFGGEILLSSMLSHPMPISCLILYVKYGKNWHNGFRRVVVVIVDTFCSGELTMATINCTSGHADQPLLLNAVYFVHV